MNDAPATEEAEVGYRVEKLLARKKSAGQRKDGFRKGTWIYLVKWEGYLEAEATWEAAKNISDDSILEFEEEIGSPHSSDEHSTEEAPLLGEGILGKRADRPKCTADQSTRRAMHKAIFGSDDSECPSE